MPSTWGLTAPLTEIRRALRAYQPVAINEPGIATAAVALTLRVTDAGVPELLFIKRAEFAGDPWSAQVAFPGGRSEPGDEDLFHTAVRETREELALDLIRDGELLGRLDDLKPVSVLIPRIVVTPFVIELRGNPATTLSHEVAQAFWIPLSVLRTADCWRPTTVTARGKTFEALGCHFQGHVIWGITERLLSQFLKLTTPL